MTPAEIQIRPATLADARFLAWVMLAADRGQLSRAMFDVVLPSSEEERVAYLAGMSTAEAASFCHYSGFLIAEQAGQRVAALSGYEPKIKTPRHFVKASYEVLTKVGWSAERIDEMLARFAPFLTCTFDYPEDAWVVEWVATRPEGRGQGISTRLIERILEQGRGLGLPTAYISVRIGNHTAQRVYERAGFTVFDERCHPDHEAAIGCPGLTHLKRPL
jgi:ribosomal protein S18 acetylase RimI-like enzyme